MNIVIMKNGKSRLIESLCIKDTLVIDVGRARVPQLALAHLDDVYYSFSLGFDDMMNENGLGNIKKKNFKRIIFYSYEKYSVNRVNCLHLENYFGEAVCFFMFSED